MNKYAVTRRFRGTTYKITIANPSGVNRGVKRILVDRQEIAGNRLPLFADSKQHTVEVTLG